MSGGDRLTVARGRRLRVVVPATSANLGPGFDTLGIALARYDELELETCEPGVLEIVVEGVGEGEVPLDESHLVVKALDASLAELGASREGLRLRARNRIPHGRGMGSSGAAIVAGVLLAAGLVRPHRPVAREELLRLATMLEGHPDNVAPCLLGGLTIAWMNGEEPRAKELQVHRGISPLVLVPSETMSTKVARSLQPEQVPHEDAIFNVSRSALLVASMTQSPEFLLEATEDRLHQSYRAAAMPHTSELVGILREAGFPAVVSGAGPSVLVLCPGPSERLAALEVAKRHTATSWEPHLLAIDVLGATVEEISEKTASPSA